MTASRGAVLLGGLFLAACAEPSSVTAPASPLERTWTVQGVPVHALTAGNPSDPCLLLLHGQAFQARTWAELGTLGRAAGHGLFAVALDLPGFGASPPSGVAREDFVAAFLDASEIERPILVAPSMSGAYALPFAARHPERLAGLVPIAPAGIDALGDELGGARVPALVLWGSEDRVVPLSVAETLVARLPDAELAVLEGASHPCYLDRPERFHELLFAFCERVR